MSDRKSKQEKEIMSDKYNIIKEMERIDDKYNLIKEEL